MDDSPTTQQPTGKQANAETQPAPSGKPRRRSRKHWTLRAHLAARQQMADLRQQVPGWVASLLVHAVAILLLAFVTLPLTSPPELSLQAANVVEESFDEEESLVDVSFDVDQSSLEESFDQQFDDQPQIEVLAEELDTADVTPLETITEMLDYGASMSDLGEISATEVGMSTSGLAGRSAQGKASLLMSGGGTRSSERAVYLGLDWLARHQYPDGSWNFDHSASECNGRCSNPGTFTQSRAAATGLALLSYLGAGHTQSDGSYQRVVSRGILALGNLLKPDENGGSFWDPQGRMYSHGIATMAMCEAYAMTGEPILGEASQAAINYVCNAQDPNGGGWRYTPRQSGDTSVVGWQIGALKSGYLSNLAVPSIVVQRASGFLDSVSFENGSRYYYYTEAEHANTPAVTAIGLLSRMYMGVERDDPGIQAGIAYLAKTGPSRQNAYYNYYAAQALFHYTAGKGPTWRAWNEEMREFLVDSQIQEGHAAGSWDPAEQEDYGRASGGRLYTTALSVMTLEVYYRMLPIYREDAVAGEFKFEQ